MRVCLLSDGYPPWERGGAQKVAAQLAEGYVRRGHDASVVTTVTDRDAVGRSTENGVAVHRVWSPRPRGLLPYLTLHNPAVAGPVERLLDRLAPDVVHAHNVHWLSNAALRAAAERAPVVKTFHDAGTVAFGDFDAFLDDVPVGDPVTAAAYRHPRRRQVREAGLRYNPVRNRLNRRCLAECVDVGVAVSDELRRALAANGVDCDETVRNGVAVEEFPRSPPADRLPFDADAPVVLFGGRTSYEKGGAHLARAFRRVAADVPDAELVVTGDDDYVERMRELAGRHADRLTATGWLSRERLRAAFAGATVVASPSVFLDPFPTVNLEAFAAGTPVVTTRFGGASELVTDGEDGFVVDPRDADALADALRRLLADPPRAAQFGERGRRTVADSFAVERAVDGYLSILNRARER
ncbi:hypothetical protein DMJ13_10020 [halophilic archaeon]|nr:hypothetical protein DMJ13_10020 [halophilic archaeon]